MKTKNIIIAGALATTMMLTPTLARAQSLNDILRSAGLNEAQIASVIAITGTNAAEQTLGVNSGFSWDGTLIKFGSRGEQVRMLQNCMNTLGYSTGVADGIYGRNTYAGISTFQAAKGYRVDGIVGKQTAPGFMAACNSASPVVNPVVIITDETMISPAPSRTSNLEANISRVKLSSADNDSIAEGDKKAAIAEIEIQIDDADATLERLDLIIDYVGDDSADEDDAWKVFTNAHIMIDGKTIATKSLSNKKDWSDQSISGDYATAGYDSKENRFRISGIKEVLKKNKKHTITIAVDVAKSVKLGSDNQSDWVFAIDRQSLRFTDSAKLVHYVTEESGVAGEYVSFVLEQEGAQDELTIRSLSSENTGTIIKVEDSKKSKFTTILEFEVDVDKDSSDIEANTIALAIETAGANVNDVITELELRIGDMRFDKWSFKNINAGGIDYTGASTQAFVAFDVKDKDLIFENNKKTKVSVMAEFKSANGTNYSQGVSLQSMIPTSLIDLWEVEGADDLSSGQLKGSVLGTQYVLLTKGINTNVSSTTKKLVSVSGDNNDIAEFEIEMDITAFEQVAYIPELANVAMSYSIVDASNGSVVYASEGVQTGTAVVSIASNAAETNGYYRFDEGKKKQLTLSVSYVPANAGSYRLRVDTIKFNNLAQAPNMTFLANPASDFRTGNVNVIN